MTFHFIDRHGVDWMVIPGLPVEHPAAAEGVDAGSPISMGFTFRASTGELRVLAHADIRRTPGALPNVAWRGRPRLARTSADWEGLLDQARPWP